MTDVASSTSPLRRSAEHIWRPSIKPIRPQFHETRGTGLKKVSIPNQSSGESDVLPPQKRHFNNTRVTQEYKVTDSIPKLHKVRDEHGRLMRFKYFGEETLENVFQRKRRIDPTDLQRTRNGIGFSKPGDNAIANIEYHPDFFKTPGIMPGSSWGNHKPLPNFHSTQWSRRTQKFGGTRSGIHGFGDEPVVQAPHEHRQMTLQQQRMAAALAEDVAQVRDLNPSSSKHSENTWEDRTGNMTIKRGEFKTWNAKIAGAGSSEPSQVDSANATQSNAKSKGKSKKTK